MLIQLEGNEIQLEGNEICCPKNGILIGVQSIKIRHFIKKKKSVKVGWKKFSRLVGHLLRHQFWTTNLSPIGGAQNS